MRGHLRSEINVTPLVDIVLVLLIVFIVLVPVVPRALAAAIPREGPGAAGPALRLTLLPGGALEADGHPLPPEELPRLVRAATGPVVLKVDPDLPLQRATDVMDRITAARPEARLTVLAAQERR